jgi:predicted dehydrogenase
MKRASNALLRSGNLVKEVIVGVVGAGVFGGYHAQKYAVLPGVRIGAVHDIDAARAGALAALHGAAPYTNYDEFLGAVDAATIAAPATVHYELSHRALEAGRHILIEKPIALSLDQADRLIDAAARRSLVVQVGHQERFVVDAFGLLARTQKPRSITCIRRNPATGRGEDVSVVLDLMIHDLDLVRRMALGDIVSMASTCDADEAEAKIVCSDGVSAYFEASRCSQIYDRRMILSYDDGSIEIDFVKRTVSNTTSTPLSACAASGANGAVVDPLGLSVALFVSAVRGDMACAIPAREARAALEWALLVEEASKLAASRQSRPMRARA